MKPIRRVMFVGVLLANHSFLLGHEFWIEPSNPRPVVGDKVDLHLRVGERFEGEPIARTNERIKLFAVLAPEATKPVAISGQDGADPAGTITASQPGLHVIGYHNHPTQIELEAGEFEDYLKHEGLEAVIAERKRLGESTRPGREAYARCAKALVTVKGAPPAGFDRPFGLPLEIIPLADPFTLKRGGELPVRLLFQQKPLGGLKVTATRRNAPEKSVSARTDGEGVARLPLDEPGLWLISAVHMTRAEPDPDADWRSLWASLTFDQRSPDQK